MNFDKLVLTENGRTELNLAKEGRLFEISHIALGDGQSDGGDEEKSNLTHELMRIGVSRVVRIGAEVIVECIINTKVAPEAFYMREIGLIANNLLCYYAQPDEEAEYIDPEAEYVIKQRRMRFVLDIAADININTVIGSPVYALQDDLDYHFAEKDNPHRVTKSQVGLGNVPDVSTNDQTPVYTEQELGALVSGEKMSTAFGKLDAAVKGLIGHISEFDVHVTAHEKMVWNEKAGTAAASSSANGLMSAEDKTKLDGLAVGANNYEHPAVPGNKHIPAGGAANQILKWGADGTAVWSADESLSAEQGKELSGLVAKLNKDFTDNWKKIYPLGAIYISASGTSPATLFGGTWEKIENKFLLAASIANVAGSEGGVAEQTLSVNELPAHTHTFRGTAVNSGIQNKNHIHNGTTGDSGAHKHTYSTACNLQNFARGDEPNKYGFISNGAKGTTDNIGNHNHTIKTGENSADHYHSIKAEGKNDNAGGGKAHNNMPPFLAVYMWKRTA